MTVANRSYLGLALLLIPSGAWALSPADPSVAFARYIASLDRAPVTVEVEIEGSLPRLGKQGRLQAIRYSGPSQKSEYQILRTDGDRTVKQQVIARYLSAQEQAELLPAASVAITPANYKFRYMGSIDTGESRMYGFEITPKRKGEGLIQGQLWIDSATGIAVHQQGRLVKSPSVFLRGVEIRRDTEVRDGIPGQRVTHLAMSTRLVGPAELTITERPWTPVSAGETTPFLLAAGGKR